MGILLAALGAAGVYFSARLSMGTAVRMGPGYFPTLVSWILIGFGALIFARSVVITGPPIEGGRVRPLIAVLAAVLAFTLGIEHLGLAATIALMVVIAGVACTESQPLEVAIAAVVLAGFSCGLFIGLLGLPMRVLPPFLELSALVQAPMRLVP